MRAARTSGWSVVACACACACACAAGCSFSRSNGAVGDDDGDAPIPIDAAIDAPPDSPPLECELWMPAPQHFAPCEIPAPLEDGLTLDMTGVYTLDTTARTLRTPAGGAPTDLAAVTQELAEADGPVLLLSVRTFVVGALTTVRVIGNRPLLVASWSTMAISGTVDAGSHIAVTDPGGNQPLATAIDRGAGSAPAACATGAAGAGGDGTSGTGGGGGGAFQGNGGTGGKGDTGGVRAAGPGGAAVGATPTSIRGGCDGAVSGAPGAGAVMPSTATTVSPAGGGGGGIQLTARTAISITAPNGRVTAGGSGGGPAQKGSADGGGGGGSGGLIGIEAPTFTLSGTLAANGGGGGTSARFVDRGVEGQDGRPNGLAAPGGVPVAGSNGCATQAAPGSNGAGFNGGSIPANLTCDCGGAGGGGAAGFILVRAPTFTKVTPTISPTETILP